MGTEPGDSTTASAFDCRIVRQCRLTSSFRLDNPVRNLPALSLTTALLAIHRLPVASFLAHHQVASLASKSGLYPRSYYPRGARVYQPQTQFVCPQVLPDSVAMVSQRFASRRLQQLGVALTQLRT